MSTNAAKHSSHHSIPHIGSLLPRKISHRILRLIAQINSRLGRIARAPQTMTDQIAHAANSRRRTEGEIGLVACGVGIFGTAV